MRTRTDPWRRRREHLTNMEEKASLPSRSCHVQERRRSKIKTGEREKRNRGGGERRPRGGGAEGKRVVTHHERRKVAKAELHKQETVLVWKHRWGLGGLLEGAQSHRRAGGRCRGPLPPPLHSRA